MIGAVLMSLGLMCEAVTAQPPVKDGPTMTGQVTQVILYQGQALITRTIPLEGLQGANEIIISGLPEQVVQDSVFAEGSDGVEIRAVRFRSRAVGEEPREEVRKLDEALEKANDTLQANQRLTQNLTKQGQFLDQMDNFVAPTAKADLARGVLDAIGLERIAQFSFGQRDVAAKSTAELEKANREVTRQVTLLTRKREELTRGSQKAVREALLFVEKKGAAKDTLRLNYLVGSCGWSPTYTFRATDDRKTVAMECNALIHQMTGEDWSNVQLTLSTASPGLSAAGPGLAAFPISLVPAGQTARLNSRDVEEQVKGIKQRQYDANEANRKAIKLSESLGSSFAANTAAGEFQSLELGVGKDVLASVVSIRDQVGPSLSYQLANPVSLASRSDQQMVRILKTQFKSSFYYVATPVLTSQVYREAELVNQSADDLLAGPIAVYLEGRFVGQPGAELQVSPGGGELQGTARSCPALRSDALQRAGQRDPRQAWGAEGDPEHGCPVSADREAEKHPALGYHRTGPRHGGQDPPARVLLYGGIRSQPDREPSGSDTAASPRAERAARAGCRAAEGSAGV
jgi:uncharacterized protein (TIGR02231 family)